MLSGFALYPRWVPLREPTTNSTQIWRRRRDLNRTTLVGGERSYHYAILCTKVNQKQRMIFE